MQDLYAKVTSIRTAAFDLVAELAGDAGAGDPRDARTLALVRMQAVANALGRVQEELGAPGGEPAARALSRFL